MFNFFKKKTVEQYDSYLAARCALIERGYRPVATTSTFALFANEEDEHLRVVKTGSSYIVR